MLSGKRVCLVEAESQAYGTIRYFGKIKPWGKKDCVGVEWDDEGRGRNDGSVEYEGQIFRYFTTRKCLNTGSFLKVKKVERGTIYLSKGRRLITGGRTLSEALNYRYNETKDMDVADESGMHFGTKTVEKYGFEELVRRQANFGRLEVVSFDRMFVNDEENADTMPEKIPSVTDMDLSYNLLGDWSYVVKLSSCLKALKTLRVSGNWFTWSQTRGSGNVNKLLMANSGAGFSMNSTSLINTVVLGFPHLDLLDLSGNYLEMPERTGRLSTLDLSFNLLKGVMAVPHGILGTLLINNNEVTGLEGALQSLKKLDVSDNQIGDWRFLDTFADQFPNLVSIKMTQNPVFEETESESGYDWCLMQIIGRVESITQINGTEYSAEHRQNYELYFISKVMNGEVSRPSATRWMELLRRYKKGNTDTAAKPVSTNTVLTVVRNGEIAMHSLVFADVTTVGSLRGKISKRLGISILRFGLEFPTVSGRTEKLANDQDFLSTTGIEEEVYVCDEGKDRRF